MPSTLSDQLKQAAGQPPPVDMAAIDSRSARLRRRQRVAQSAGAVAAVLTLVGIGAFVAWLASVGPSIDPATVPTVLSVPPVDEVAGEFLGDGTPVWVVHHEDGEVSVLEAETNFSVWAHRWCPVLGVFESHHWSRFDAWGRYLGGPAGVGLSRYPAVVEGSRVTVALGDPIPGTSDMEAHPPPPRFDPDRRPTGVDTCDETQTVYHPAWQP